MIERSHGNTRTPRAGIKGSNKPKAKSLGKACSVLEEGELQLAGMKFRCFVLHGGIRTILHIDFMDQLGIYRSGALSTRRSKSDALRIPLSLAFKNLRPFILQDDVLTNALRNPIRCRMAGRAPAACIPSSLLRQMLNVWIRASEAGVLRRAQKMVAEKARKLSEVLDGSAIDTLIDQAITTTRTSTASKIIYGRKRTRR